jgi:LDH2 family malate/lactate/ureidoglycolate dehydrogenase
MSEATTDRVHLSIKAAQSLGESAMRGAGFNASEARILTDHVIDAAVCGYEYSGLPKLLNVVDAPDFQKPRGPVQIIRESSVSALMDGGHNTGMLAVHYATEEAIKRATQHGVAIICLSNSWMSGRSAYYCEAIARAGLIGIHTVSAPAMVAPFGGAKAALGTNPIAFGFPSDDDPLVIDMGTSAFMGTDLQFRERLDASIPEGVAVDPDGQPTTNAAAARLGALLPFGGPDGGYKGFGLALAMDALGALTAGVRGADEISGYLIIAFKPDLFLPLADYRKELSDRIATIKATPLLDGFNEIRIPGERAYRLRREMRRDGIEVEAKIIDLLTKLSKSDPTRS